MYTIHQKNFFFLNQDICNHFKLSHHDMPNCDKEHTAGASGQHGMLTSPKHTIQPLSF